jgi:FMN-dependent NADH-azoreductase
VPKLFHLACSPRANAVSSAAARGFLQGFSQARPSWEIDTMDVWRERMPEFDGAALEAKYARQEGRPFSTAEQDAFAQIERMAVRLSLAERVVISTPMWNFSLPYKLKHWFDLIIQPGLTFRFEPGRGYIPLLKDRPALVIVASGSDFSTGMNRGRIDMATPYLREALRFIGIQSLRIVAIGPTTGPREPADAAFARAQAQLADLARHF